MYLIIILLPVIYPDFSLGIKGTFLLELIIGKLSLATCLPPIHMLDL